MTVILAELLIKIRVYQEGIKTFVNLSIVKLSGKGGVKNRWYTRTT